MKTFHDFCKDQIGRFAGRMGWPNPKEFPAAVRDLIESLERGSRGHSELAKRIVDTCVEASQYCPTVPDLLRVAQELRDQEATGPKFGFAGCAECSFSGWRVVERDGSDYAFPCECRPKPQTSPARPPDGGRASKASGCDARMRQAGER